MCSTTMSCAVVAMIINWFFTSLDFSCISDCYSILFHDSIIIIIMHYFVCDKSITMQTDRCGALSAITSHSIAFADQKILTQFQWETKTVSTHIFHAFHHGAVDRRGMPAILDVRFALWSGTNELSHIISFHSSSSLLLMPWHAIPSVSLSCTLCVIHFKWIGEYSLPLAACAMIHEESNHRFAFRIRLHLYVVVCEM